MDFSTLVAALQIPEIYPEHPAKVDLVQTHVSAILLTGEHAYKVKKPVDFGFLDFSTLEALFERARNILERGFSLIIDASFKKQLDRREAWALAQQAGADFLLIECQLPEREVRRRLARRVSDPDEPSDGRWELFATQRKDFERVVEMSPDFHLTLRTEGSVEDCLGVIFQHLLRKAGREGVGSLEVK